MPFVFLKFLAKKVEKMFTNGSRERSSKDEKEQVDLTNSQIRESWFIIAQNRSK
jgi:hypothetical protein